MDFELREWELSDADDVAKYANNEKIACNLRDVFPYPYTIQDARGYIESCLTADKTKQLCYAIVANHHAVGSIGVFLGTDVYRKSAELGYWLAEEYWGKGIMTEAVRKICGKAFDVFDINRIYAEPFTHNIGSRKVLEKTGFVLEGIMRSGVCKGNQIFDYCMYALLRE
jgi:ribosomal-protein-alanine N-acetyltransferase